MKRLSMSLPDDRFEFLNKQSKKLGIARSSVVSIAIGQYIDSQKMLDTLPELVEEIRRQQQKTEDK